ncbi:protein RIC-3b [Betta splendens]|uniref:Protein RIC-3b n=1 Tax=Betta splendens TaxID=158456 RepID=A0A6P7MWU9_BETSP|nr:protein RIC-3b [Betta splendens]
MPMSTFQKVTLATGLVLCVALLLPKMLLSRGRKDAERPEGHFPPMMHRQAAPESRGQRPTGSGYSRPHNSESGARGKGAGTGAGAGGKSNLAGQIIPVYGFGILLYILYILFKITSKGNSKPSESRFTSVRSENMKRKITDYELAQLQEKLRETELVMEKIVSSVHHSPERVNGVMADQEESLLQQLTEITRVMQEGQLVEGMAAERKAQSSWEDYPEEPQQYWDHSCCSCHHTQQPDSPPTQTELERTEADGADTAEAAPAEHDTGEEDAEEALEPSTDAGRQTDYTAPSDEDVELDSGLAAGQGHIELGVLEEDLGGDLRVPEQDLNPPEETESSSNQVRRRNRRRRAKKASQ